MKVRKRAYPLMPEQRAAMESGKPDPRKGKRNSNSHIPKMRTNVAEGQTRAQLFTRSELGY